MRLLLDTHVFLWWLHESGHLSPAANAAILDRGNSVYVSAISVFEVRLKHALRKITIARNWWEKLCEQDFEHLSFSADHANATQHLPFVHRDPFDRMLIAQAQVESMTFVTRDRELRKYPVAILTA
jgi:PIN domain nuclease of toxin-antitoxin system